MRPTERNLTSALALAALLLTAPPVAQAFNMESYSAVQRSQAYREAQAELDDGNWRNAAEIFGDIAEDGGAEADAALYWAAYALYKQGRTREAAASINALRDRYPSSSWIEDAEALAVEMGETDPAEVADEELKLFALNSLMHANPDRAVPVLEEFLAGSSSLKLKKQALFVLSQSHSAKARQILADVATGSTYPRLRREAVQYLGISGDSESRAMLETIYRETTDLEVKEMVLESFMIAGDRTRLFTAAKSESDPELRRKAIEQLGVLGAGEELEELYGTETTPQIKKALLEGMMIGGNSGAVYRIATTDPDATMRRRAIEYLGVMGAGEELRRLYEAEESIELRGQILEAYMIGGDVEALEAAARGEEDPKLRREAIQYLGVSGGRRAGKVLADLYPSATETEEKRQIIEALFIQNNAEEMIEIIKVEEDAGLKRMALERLSLMGSDEAVDFLIEALKEPSDG